MTLRFPDWKLICALVLVNYFVFAGALAYTKRPWSDEAWFAASAVNIAENGKTGISVLDPKGNANMLGREFRKVDEKFLVWIPVQQSVNALFYKIVGFSLFTMRGISMLWGVVALAAWFVIVRVLTGDVGIAALATAIISSDFAFLDAASDGRMDMMCAALSYAAIALYLHLREQRLLLGVVVSQVLTVTAGLTHPMGAIGFITVLFLITFFDRGRIKWRHLLAAAGVYLVGVMVVAAYLLPDYALFREHLSVALSGRLGVVKSTGSTFVREFTTKYRDFYAPSYGSAAANMARLVTPAIYLLGLLACLFLRPLRQTRGILAVALLAIVSQTAMAILDSGKLYYYLVHSTPYLAAALAGATGALWRTGNRLRYFAAGGVLLVILLQHAWTVAAALKDPYHRSFLPMAEYVSRQTKAASGSHFRITASAELGFAIGFHEPLRDDSLIGYQSGRRPDLIVFDERSYISHLNGFAIHRPEVADYVRDLLAREYTRTYSNGYYNVYERKPTP